ncbi:MAG: response regulator [Bdellovibrionales bacterium]|nr:response regulator [Bdellovibrionales bacterium]
MKHIVVIEDNPDNQLVVEAILKKRYRVSCFETGLTAYEYMLEEIPDAMLLDISLPDMDGPEVLALIRSSMPLRNIPAIALTAHAMQGDKEKFLGLGFQAYMSKPILDEEMLYNVIEETLKSKRDL